LDSYDDLISTLTRPVLQKITSVVLIDESLRRKLGKWHTLKLIQQITSPSMNCYVDGITKGTPDNDVNNIFYSYVNIPDLILTSDKDLHEELARYSLYAKKERKK
jgi:hypothetical protein